VYDSLNMEVQVAKSNLLKYGEKKEDSRLFSQRDEQNLVNVVVVEDPTRPGKPKSPNRMLAFQVSVVLGMFSALVLPFVLETLDHKLKTVEDVERIMDLPVVCIFNER
jgi:capsular polysaccharide biosynthesis protein